MGGGGGNLVINTALLIFKTNGSLEEGSSVEAPLYFIKGWLKDDDYTFIKKWDNPPFPLLYVRQACIIGASSSLEPLDTIDNYRNNASLIHKVYNNFFWVKPYGVLSKLVLYSDTSAMGGIPGIMQIDFCNENDVVRHTLYLPTNKDIMPILGEMYIGIQYLNNVLDIEI